MLAELWKVRRFIKADVLLRKLSSEEALQINEIGIADLVRDIAAEREQMPAVLWCRTQPLEDFLVGRGGLVLDESLFRQPGSTRRVEQNLVQPRFQILPQFGLHPLARPGS